PVRVETVRREAIVPDRERLREERLRGTAPQGDARPDRHVLADSPVPHGLVAQGLHGLLLRHELEHLLRLHELLACLADAHVDYDFLDPNVAHAAHGPTYIAETAV